MREYALLAFAFVLWIVAGTFLLAELDAHARSGLQAELDTRAAHAAGLLDDQLSRFIRAAEPLQQASSADRRTDNADSSHVAFLARNNALEPVSSDDNAATDSRALDTRGASAAKVALITQTPQVSAARGETDKAPDAIDIWFPSRKDGSEAALLQMHVPLTLLHVAISENPGRLAVTDSNGRFLVNLQTPADGVVERSDYLEATSKTSPLGFQVRASESLRSVQSANQRNWICFLLVTSLLMAGTAVLMNLQFLPFQKRIGKWLPNRRGQIDDVIGHARSDRYLEADNLISRGRAYPSPPLQERNAIAEERLHTALEAGGICAWEWHRSSGSVLWRTTCSEILKLPPDAPAMTARGVLRRIFPHERRRLLHLIRTGLAEGRALTADVRIRRSDGDLRWVALSAQTLRDQSGNVTGYVGIAQDITDQKQSLSRTDSLLREVSHRSKNMLALILAMARLTAREAIDVKSHLREFALRVSGLAASQDLIVAADWQSVDFRTLASAEIEAVARSDAERIKISGPTLLITPEAAQTLGMILTELALNAVEHGALSVATGKAELSWALPADGTIIITWRETGGPIYDSERPKGYGLSVVERFSTQGLKLESRISSDWDTFTWTLTGPAANVESLSSRSRR